MEKKKKKRISRSSKKYRSQELFLDAYLSKLTNVTSACKEAGISRVTYYEWMKDPEFEKRLNQRVDSINDMVRQVALVKASKGDRDLIKFWLKTQLKNKKDGVDGFVERTETELSTRDDKPLNINIIAPTEKKEE